MRPVAFHGPMRGFALVELMVGVAVSLFVIAGALAMLSNNVGENRRLLLETQVQQDLRATVDLVARDLRRAGYWRNAEKAAWHPGASAAPNPYADVSVTSEASTSEAVLYHWAKDGNDTVDGAEQLGFRLNKGALEMQLGDGNWQTMTDASTLVVTSFDVRMHEEAIDLQGFCPRDCPAGSATCPPKQLVREFIVSLSGRAAHDPQVQRGLEDRVRMRNDAVTGACPV